MIFFRFSIANPFAKGSTGRQKDYIVYDESISKNKAFSMQFSKWSQKLDIIALSIDTQWIGQDHGGLGFTLEILGFFFDIKLYDKRHWDFDRGAWEVYDEKDDN